MVQGIDETFDALILIGYHSMAGTENGMGRESGRTIHPEVTRKAIIDSVSEALSDVSRFKPFQSVSKPSERRCLSRLLGLGTSLRSYSTGVVAKLCSRL